MSRIAEASACAGRAVPDSSRVDWAKERAAAETLLNDGTPENAARPAENAARPAENAARPAENAARRAPALAAAARAVDPIVQTAAWPPKFDLDDVDLSSDSYARSFRRFSTTSGASHVQRRTDLDAATLGDESRLRDRSDAATTPVVSDQWVGYRQIAPSAERGAWSEPVGTDRRRVPLRWVIIIVALMIVLASAAVLTYVLWNRRGATQQNVDPSARFSPTSVVQVTGQAIS